MKRGYVTIKSLMSNQTDSFVKFICLFSLVFFMNSGDNEDSKTLEELWEDDTVRHLC